MAVVVFAVPVFFVQNMPTRSLVRHVGRYDPSSTTPPDRRILHLYFTEGRRGSRSSWPYTVEALIGAGALLPPSETGETQFTGYDREGRVLFVRSASLVRDAHPGLTYLADVPATPNIEHRLGRIDVTFRGRTYTRRALPLAPPSARAVAVDDSHILIDLNCAHYSSIMVHYAEDRDLTADSNDALETFRNCWTRVGPTSLRTPIETHNRRIYLDFNNGLLYTERAVEVTVRGRG
jgi:hypothetical protein